MPRRSFLVTAAAVCSAGVSACMHTNSARLVAAPAVDGTVRLRLADEPELATVGGAIKVKAPDADDTLLVWRSGPSEISATSIHCTHMGCEVEVADGGRSLACPCHGSAFGPDGSVRHGPATKPLRRYVVETSNGEAIVRPA